MTRDARRVLAALRDARARADRTEHLFPCCDGVDEPCPGAPQHVVRSVYVLGTHAPEVGKFCDSCLPNIERLARKLGVRITIESPLPGASDEESAP